MALIGCYKPGIPVGPENIFVTFWNNPLLRLIFGSLLRSWMTGQETFAGPFSEYLPVKSRTDRNTDLFNKTDASYHPTTLLTAETKLHDSLVLSPILELSSKSIL